MHARFVQSSVLAVAGGFVVVASQAFSNATTAWLAFAIGAGAIVLAAVPLAAGIRGPVLSFDGVIAAFGVWTVVASLAFTGTTVQWLSFGEGAVLAALAVIGLTLDHLVLSRSARGVTTSRVDTLTSVDRTAPVAA